MPPYLIDTNHTNDKITTTDPSPWTMTVGGKLIITGEYSVLKGYGAMGIPLPQLSATTTVVPINNCHQWAIHFPNLGKDFIYPFSDHSCVNLDANNNALKEMVEGYQTLSAQHDPSDDQQLQPFAAILQELPLPPGTGGTITLRSRVPLGAGFGSSSAASVSFIKAVDHLRSQIAPHQYCPMTPNAFLRLAKKAEDYSHGRSSGFDLAICYYGTGIIIEPDSAIVKEGEITKGGLGKKNPQHQHNNSHYEQGPRLLRSIDVPTILGSHMIHTGRPSVSTKDCVHSVMEKHPTTSGIWSELGAVSAAVMAAYNEEDYKNLKTYLPINHQLLCRLGVVPEKVQRFIAIWQNFGGLAKTSGAGSISGNNAGAVFSMIPPEEIDNIHVFEDLCRHYGYRSNSLDHHAKINRPVSPQIVSPQKLLPQESMSTRKTHY